MALNEPYKLEILESIKEDPITIYHIGKKSLFELPEIPPHHDTVELAVLFFNLGGKQHLIVS